MSHYLSPEAAIAAVVRERRDIPVTDTWNLEDIFPGLPAWEAACQELEAGIRADVDLGLTRLVRLIDQPTPVGRELRPAFVGRRGDEGSLGEGSTQREE